MNNSKTICFVNSVKTWGGGEKWHFEMALKLKDKGHHIIFLCQKKSALSEKLSPTNIPLKHFKVNNLSFLNLPKIFQISSFLSKEKIDIIIMNYSADIKTVGPAAKLAGIKKIIYRRGSAIPIKNSFLNQFLFKKVLSGVIANSEATKRTILENNPSLFPKEKIAVIHNGLETEKRQIADISPFPEIKTNGIVLGNAGRLVHQKGQDFLIDIAKALKQKGKQFTLLIAGQGPLETTLIKRIEEENLEKEIILLGFVEDVNSFMASIDIFLLTSRWEGFGFVLAEAMLNKKPIIAWDISSNPELVKHGKTGFLIPPFDSTLFAEKIIELANDANKRDLFGQNGYSFVINNFSFDQITKKLCKYLEID